MQFLSAVDFAAPLQKLQHRTFKADQESDFQVHQGLYTGANPVPALTSGHLLPAYLLVSACYGLWDKEEQVTMGLNSNFALL